MVCRVLHVLSNWKWTERSEPAVDLALAEKRLGADVGFVCGRAPQKADESVTLRARTKGLESIIALPMSKHFQPSSLVLDIPKLRALMNAFTPHVIHFHMRNAHLMGVLAGLLPSAPFRRVRTCYDPWGPQTDLRSRFLYRHHTDGLIVIGRQAKASAMKLYDFTGGNCLIAEPGVDLDRFSTKPKAPPTKEVFGLSDDTFVAGVVSRIRESRRIDIALGAVNMLAERFPQLRLLIVGRGRKGAVEDVVAGPSRAMGIADKVIVPGYCDGDRLVAAYRAMDVLVYPTPGTDQTCRTVREALASGVPVIAPKHGFLPELLADGVNGHFIDLSAQSLASVLGNVIGNRERLHQMAQNAAREAKERFSTRLQAQKVLAFYDKLMANVGP